MFEFLMFVSPLGTAISPIFGFASFILVFVCLVLYMNDEYTAEYYDKMRITAKRYLFVSLFVFILATILSSSKEGIINVYVYRAVTSETVDKAIETLNTLFDRINVLSGDINK